MKYYLEEYVTPDLHTRSMHMQADQFKDKFSKN